jgi:hypothetical protein
MELNNLSFTQLKELLSAVEKMVQKKDPANIAREAAEKKYDAERTRMYVIRETRQDKILKFLKTTLVPGQRLKMSGCKDGKGIREFIKWDENNNLVCWQIAITDQWMKAGFGDMGKYVRREVNTNTVTTHMPDKVVWFDVKGAQVSVKKHII